MRQRRQHAHHRQLADVARAVIAFQPPDGDDQFLRHAELLLHAPEDLRVLLQHLLAA
jgi:hypothetical protein